MKFGANETDQVYIKRGAGEGKTAAILGKELGIDPKVVEKFMPIAVPKMEKKKSEKKE